MRCNLTMQYKRIAIWLAIAAMALAFGGCNPSKNASGQDHERPTSLMTKDDVFQTLDGGYHEYFEPRAEGYGQLVPYVGGMRKDTVVAGGDEITCMWWGLCTADGKAVTDAVYTSVDWYRLDDGTGVFELHEQDVDAFLDGDETYSDHCWVIAEDGSWMIDGGDRSYLYGTENHRIVLTTRDDPVWYRLYDYDGKAVASIEGKRGDELSLRQFSGGYAYVEHWSAEHEQTVGYYINRKGERVFTNDFSYGDVFEDGKAVVCLVGEQYGILNENGTWFVEPEYAQITRWDNYFVLNDGTNCSVMDSSGHEWRKFPNTNNVSLVVGKRVLYATDRDDTLRYLDSNDVVVNTGNRKAITVRDTYSPTFLTSKNEKEHLLHLVDYTGREIAVIEDFGHVGSYDDRYLYVYSHSNEKELRLIRLTDGAQVLSTTGFAYSTPLADWYCVDESDGNYTLRNMTNNEQIRFPNTNLLVQQFGGKVYYQTFNTTVSVLMDEHMTPILKLKNES